MADLYFGFALDSGTATPGSTPGFTYATDSSGDGIAWDVNAGTGGTAPAWGDAGSLLGVMALISETAPQAAQVTGFARRHVARLAEGYRFAR
jgi:hypothetical protein